LSIVKPDGESPAKDGNENGRLCGTGPLAMEAFVFVPLSPVICQFRIAPVIDATLSLSVTTKI
jgi:hypothetical protein